MTGSKFKDVAIFAPREEPLAKDLRRILKGRGLSVETHSRPIDARDSGALAGVLFRGAFDELPSVPEEKGPRVLVVIGEEGGEPPGPQVLLAQPDWPAEAVASLIEAAVRLARAELLRAEAESLLEDLASSQENFVGIASHDLRTPISSLKLAFELIRSGSKARREELFEIVDHSIGRMEALVQDVLEAWRLYRGRPSLRVERFDLAFSIEDVAAGFFPAAMKKNIALDLILQDRPCHVEADRRRVEQVLMNLVENAVKFTPPGGTVRVSARKEKGAVLVRVEDTGPGITDEEKTDLFKRFGRGKARATGGEPSTGLGLFICKEIVEMHGGEIWVESEPGEGSRFLVRLPARVKGGTGA